MASFPALSISILDEYIMNTICGGVSQKKKHCLIELNCVMIFALESMTLEITGALDRVKMPCDNGKLNFKKMFILGGIG